MTFDISVALKRHAYLTPHALCVSDEDRMLSYAEFDQQVDILSRALVHHGVGEGHAIGTCARNSIELLTLMHAAARVHARFVTFNFWLRDGELRELIEHSRIDLLLVDSYTAERSLGATAGLENPPTVVSVDDDVDRALPWNELASHGLGNDAPAASPTRDFPFWMMYTSGTTGRPKGVLRSMENTMKCLWYGVMDYEFKDSDVFLAVAPMFHGVTFLPLMVLQKGGHVVVRKEFDAKAVVSDIVRLGITASFLVPTMLGRISREEAFESLADSELRILVTGAAPRDIALESRVAPVLGHVLHEFYGATETGFVSVLRPSDRQDRRGSCGQIGIGMEVQIRDDDGTALAAGQVGEIYTRSDGGITEYFRDAQATEEALVDSWFATGDIGRLDEGGFLYILDRKKDMIISGGENIYPSEVESVLAAYPGVAEAAVVGVKDADWGESVIAFVVLEPGETVEPRELNAHCRSLLASFKCPREITVIDELPRSSVGKVLKRELRISRELEKENT